MRPTRDLLASAGVDVTAVRRGVLPLPVPFVRPVIRGTARPAVADATAADLGERQYDLVVVLYLHLPRAVVLPVLTRAAAAVAGGGRLLVLGHDRDNLTRGVGGPQDPDLLYDVDLLAAAAEGLDADRLEQVARTVGEATAVDTLLVAHRIAP